MHLDTYHKPPRLAAWILGKLFPDNDKHTTLGDLAEVYNTLKEERNLLFAMLWYWFQLLKAIPIYLISSLIATPGLFKNYFVVALRNMRRNLLYTFINIFGLSIGITACIFAFLYAKFEFTYDLFHKNANNIYAVGMVIKNNNPNIPEKVGLKAPHAVTKVLIDSFSDIKSAISLQSLEHRIKYLNEDIKERIWFADEGIFNVFSFSLIHPITKGTFNQQNVIIISEKISKKFFNSTNTVGMQILLKLSTHFEMFEIIGVLKQPPANSSMKIDFLINIANLEKIRRFKNFSVDWNAWPLPTFILSDKKVNVNDLEPKLPNLVEEFGMNGRYRIGGEEYFSGELRLIQLKNLHFHELRMSMFGSLYSKNNVYFLSALAIAILFVALVNVINLRLSKTLGSINEINVRQYFGAKSRQIFGQIFIESFGLSLLALIVSSLLCRVFLTMFNRVVKTNIESSFFLSIDLASFLFFLALFIAAVNSFFPSHLLIKHGLKGALNNIRQLRQSREFNKILITIQYSIFLGFSVITVTMFNQIKYLDDKDLGFKKNHVTMISAPRTGSSEKFAIFKETILHKNIVSSVSESYEPLISSSVFLRGLQRTGFPRGFAYIYGDKEYNLWSLNIDNKYLPIWEIELSAGRSFTGDFIKEEFASIIVNERFINTFKIHDPIGHQITIRDLAKDHLVTKTIVGVVKDYYYRSIFRKIEPLILLPKLENGAQKIWLNIDKENRGKIISELKIEWNRLYPDESFEYIWWDDYISSGYDSKIELAGNLMFSTAIFAMISLLGIIGIVSLFNEKRTTEIAIRKSMGASTMSVLKMINKEFIWLILLSNVIAWPVAYLVMEKWLDQFYYKIDLTIWYFIGSSLIGLVIALLTISAQAYKAASANPVDALRRE